MSANLSVLSGMTHDVEYWWGDLTQNWMHWWGGVDDLSQDGMYWSDGMDDS